ncbi:transglycosylase domain-containing protein [Reichenbachiella sp. MALMAid0571]|uniref:transglycosylase domain-containing protein n=1 Tax=Reichenbachiella sp. MALMAid0571 TaxID=3143939 RepID=UPI0032E00AA2
MAKFTRRFIIVLWTTLILGLIISFGTFYSVSIDAFGLFGGLPSLKSLERPDPDLSSELISADGELLGKYYRSNRTPVSYHELSPELIQTLMVTEDVRFTQHSGIDLLGLARALSGVLTFEFKGGGSTLTMQLAENLYKTITENRGSLYKYRKIGQVITKIKEYIISVQLEASYTKEEILAMYLNTIEYGNNSYGIQVAAKTYFNKLPSELNYKESAILVALINAPTRYNPVRNPEVATAKRTEILYNLYKYDKISKEEYDTLKVSDLGLEFKVSDHNTGPAQYFRSVIGNYLRYWAEEHGYDLYADGLKIYTTIDSRMQQYAENAVEKHMKYLHKLFIDHLKGDAPWIDHDGNEMMDFVENAIKGTPYYKSLAKKYSKDSDSIEYYLNQPKKMTVFSWNGEIDTTMSMIDSLKYYKHFLQTGFMAMDPKSGHIKAWVGGINHEHFKYDHVKQGHRQPGSTFKPFVYATAIEAGYSPCFPVADQAVTWYLPGQDPPTWTPQNNDNGKFSGEKMTIRQAMARSINSITAYIMQKVTPLKVVETAKRLGITSPLDAVPTLCLGAGGEVSVYEMVGAYSTFVNKGIYTKPQFITRIEDQNGVVLKDFYPERKEALSEKTAYLMLHMLKGATEEEHGTARGLGWELLNENEIGAKTGTTQRASDGWFMGVTKDLVAGAWVGGDDRSIHFKYWALGQGARTAMPIWQNFMLDVYNDPSLGIEKGSFPDPTFELDVELDCNKHLNQESDSLNIELDDIGSGVF